MSLYTPTAVISLDTNTGTSAGAPFFYAVSNEGGYSRDWKRYFSSQYLPFGQGIITGIDNGPGINTYTIRIFVTTWPEGSLPYQLGINSLYQVNPPAGTPPLTWDLQKAQLETSFKKVATSLYFTDPFGVYPNLGTFNGTGVYFVEFTEVVLEWSTPGTPFIQYTITLQQSPPGTII